MSGLADSDHCRVSASSGVCSVCASSPGRHGFEGVLTVVSIASIWQLDVQAITAAGIRVGSVGGAVGHSIEAVVNLVSWCIRYKTVPMLCTLTTDDASVLVVHATTVSKGAKAQSSLMPLLAVAHHLQHQQLSKPPAKYARCW